MELDPKLAPYMTSDPTSFGSVSVQSRWPIILTQAIDDVHRSTGVANDAGKVEEGKAIVAKIAELKYELQHNRQLKPIEDDGYPDVATYNQELEQRGTPKWHEVSWLYSECYMYRRLASLFALSKHWKDYDIFSRQKLKTFRDSRAAVVELASQYLKVVKQLESPSTTNKTAEEIAEAEKVLFIEMAEICLWGNATDLSLLTNLTYEDIQKLQGSEARKSQEKNILVNDLPKAFQHLKSRQKQEERRVDIILDNAGFEVYVDLLLAGYLLHSGLATSIVLHPKSIPWFVSDVIPADFAALLSALVKPQAFYTGPAPDEDASDNSRERPAPLSEEEVNNLQELFGDWSTLHSEGQLLIRPNRFWTLPGSYWRLPTVEPELYKDLQESELVIFKGDLNYRKLTGDVAWPPTTPFEEAIGPLAKDGSGLNVLALRTQKADVITGLPEGIDEKLKATEGGGGDSGQRKWAWGGKWAVVQFSDKGK